MGSDDDYIHITYVILFIIILRYTRISLILYNVFSKCRVDCFTHYPYIIEWIVALCFYVYCILCTPFVKEVISWLRVLKQMIQFLQLNISNIFTLKKKMNCVFQKCKAWKMKRNESFFRLKLFSALTQYLYINHRQNIAILTISWSSNAKNIELRHNWFTIQGMSFFSQQASHEAHWLCIS